MDLFRDFRPEQTFTVSGVTYTAEVEVLAKIDKKGPKQYRWTVYGPTGFMVTYAVTTSLRFSAVKSELKAALQ